jgi:hypothetical protein
MSEEDYKVGASAARNKVAGFLRERGLKIPLGYTPPENHDFWYAIQEFAERYGATLPHFGEESVASRNFRESLESYKTQQELRLPCNAIKSQVAEPDLQPNSKEIKCRHCGDLFVVKRGKPGFIDECPKCLHRISYPGSGGGAFGVRRSKSTTKEGTPPTSIPQEKLDDVGKDFMREYKPKAPKISAALSRVLELFAKKRKTSE